MRHLLRKLLGIPQSDPAEVDRQRDSSIFSLELRERCAVPGTLRQLSPSGDFIQPMISACGSRVAYWGVGHNEPSHRIWVSSLNGDRKAERITHAEGIQGHPFWHPDGVRLVHFASKAKAWNPRLQFSPDRPAAQLWWLDTETGQTRQLTEGTFADERPAVTPDGRAVVFVSNRSGRLNLWRVNDDGSGLAQLTHGKGPNYRPCISPDGRTLAYFSAAADGFHQVRLLSLATHEEIECTWTRRFKWSHGPFWCYDSRSLLLHALEHGARFPALWLVVLSTGHITRLDTPGLPSASHGTLDRAERFIVCDSRDGPHTDSCQR